MSWPVEQIEMVEGVVFRSEPRGYHPEDAERLRMRALVLMRRGSPLPDLDAMPLRRVRSDGVSRQQVEGLRTVLAVWSAQYHRAAAGGAGALKAPDAPGEPRWSERQIESVRRRAFAPGVRRGVSYDERDVDVFLEEVVAAMQAGQPVPDPATARFATAGRGRGYDCREVDTFLDELTTMFPED